MAGYGRFIGRVGGLAVALGIGVAVAEGCPVAMASGGNDGTGSHAPDKPVGQEHSTPAHRIGTAAGRQRHAAATPDDPSPGTGHTTATTGGTDSERTETTDTNTAQETNRGPGDTTLRVRKHLGLDAPQHVLSRLTRTRGLTEPKPITDESTREPQTVVDPQPDPAAATFAAVEVAPQSQRRSAFRLPSTAPDVLAAAPLHRLQNLAASRLDPTAHSEERSSALPDLTAFTVNESAVNEIDAGLNSTPIGITPAASFASYSAPATTSSSLTTPTTTVSSNPIERVLSLVGLGSLFNNNSNGVAPDNPLLNGVLEWVRRTFDNGSPTDTPQSVNLSLNQGQAATPFTLTGATDRDGDTVTYQPGTYTSSSSNATLVVDTSGNATYTPATSWNGTAPASDTFAVTTSDESSGWHIHGIGGLLNAVTFGLIGDSGHTSTQTVTVNAERPSYLVDGYPNPATGAIMGHVTVANPNGTVTYELTTPPKPSVGAVELEKSTGIWTFTPTPRTALLASQVPQTTDFTITASDGTTVTVHENITGIATAPLPLPDGVQPSQTYIDARSGNAYVLSTKDGNTYITTVRPNGTSSTGQTPLTGTPNGSPVVVGNATYVITNSFGNTYVSVLDTNGNTTTQPAITGNPVGNLLVVGSTTYLLTTDSGNGTAGSSKTYVTVLGQDSQVTTHNGPDGKVVGDPIRVGDKVYLTSESNGTAVGPTGVTVLDANGNVTSKPAVTGTRAGAPIVVGNTTYLLTRTGSGTTYVTALDANGNATPTSTLTGENLTVVSGTHTSYLVARTTDGQTTHVMVLDANGHATSFTDLSGDRTGNPKVVGDTLYLSSQTDTGDMTHVTALHPDGSTTPVSDLQGDRFGDPVVVGNTTYLTTEIYNVTDYTTRTHVVAVGANGAVTDVGDISGYRTGSPVVVGDTTYLTTYDGTTSKTNLTAIGPSGIASKPFTGTPYGAPVVVGEKTYLLSKNGTGTYITALDGNGNVTQLPGERPGNPSVMGTGNTRYVLTDDSGTTTVTILRADGTPTTYRDIPGSPLAAAPIVVGETTYVTTLGHNNASSSEQTRVTALHADGTATTVGKALPGRPSGAPVITSDGTTYLITTTGDALYQYQTYALALDPTGTATPVNNAYGFLGKPTANPVVVVDGTTYLVTDRGVWAIGVAEPSTSM
ncbi:MAG: hypothetical protein H6523_10650 [Mycolicibacterium sp.]|nr:hypothetical protein [Mycolicibacterium sp.]